MFFFIRALHSDYGEPHVLVMIFSSGSIIYRYMAYDRLRDVYLIMQVQVVSNTFIRWDEITQLKPY